MDKTEPLTLTGQQADWLTFTHLACAGGPDEDVLALWALPFIGSKDPSRVNKLNNEIKTSANRKFPGLGLYLRCTRKSRRYETDNGDVRISSYRLSWNDEAQIMSPVLEAAEHADDAKAFLDRRKFADAIESVVEGINSCGLFFPLYAICLETLTKDQTTVLGDTALVTLLRGITAMNRWLSRIERGFDVDHLDQRYQRLVQTHCIQELHLRMGTLQKLRSILDTNDRAGAIFRQNPANLVLDRYRDAGAWERAEALQVEDILDGDQLIQFRQLQDLTQTLIRDSDEFFDTEQKHGFEAARDLVAEENLLEALVSTALGEPAYYFDEPDSLRDWKRSAATAWAKRVLHPRREHNEPIVESGKVARMLSGDMNSDGTAKRHNHKKPDHLGSSEY